jgi:anti-sigma regulatory factor (Ser/Thr protein kinase)
MELLADPSAPARAREMVGNLAMSVLDDERLRSLQLGVSEVVTNAVVHGSSPGTTIDIGLRFGADALRVTVSQSQPVFDPTERPAPAPRDDGGYGLPLLTVLSDRWDVEAGPPPTVWFEMDLGSRRGGGDNAAGVRHS